MKAVSKKLRQQFAEIRDLLPVLGRDSALCLGKFEDELTSSDVSPNSISQLNFWLKAAARTFFAQVEGLTYAMRHCAVRAAREGHIQLDAKEIAQLQEKKYDKITGTIGQPYRGRFDDNFKNAFRYFPRVFGSEWVLQLQGKDWENFRKLTGARDDFTHPKEAAHLFRADAGEWIYGAIAWFNNSFMVMLNDIGSRLGKEVNAKMMTPPKMSEPAKRKLALIKAPAGVEQLSDLMRETQFMGLLKLDEQEAYNVLRAGTSVNSGVLSAGKFSEFGVRLYTRFIFTEIEAFSHIAGRLLEGARIEFSDAEKDLLATKELTLKIAHYAGVFSKKFGHARIIDKSGKAWESFSRLAEFRDGITHPKGPADLQPPSDVLGSLIDSIEWYIQFLDALELSEEYVRLTISDDSLS